MNILYVGQVVPKGKIKSCTGYAASGDIFQKNMINGIANNDGVNIYIVSVYPNASYPHDKMYIKGADDYLDNDLIARNVSYINVPFLKQISQKRKIIKVGKKIRKTINIDLILCYNMYPQFGGAALYLTNKLFNCPLITIFADFPMKDREHRNFVNGFLVSTLNKITWKNISKVKYGIILNDNAKKYLDVKCKTITVPGGVVRGNGYIPEYQNIEKKQIVYAGALTEYSGVLNLMKAFEILELKDVSLAIYGDGILKGYISKESERFPNVQYMGSKPLDEMRTIMKNSWVLANPRSVDDPVSSVTFPSKLLEYIMCMRPVITTEFEGMPKEIKDITFSCGKGTSIEIASAIEKIYFQEEEFIREHSLKAYNYVVNEMNWNVQGKRIIEFIDKYVMRAD